jgi:uncharacterized membrane protein
MAVGAILRFTNLTAKPPWTDEFATLVFSLGNSFETVPLDQAISLADLLQPLQVSGFHPGNVLHYLLTEDVHPPLYFLLAHGWLQLFPAQDGGLVSLWAARSLPALLGVAAIPAMYGLARVALRSHLIAQLAAALMAVSPFAVYLAQEARHYTLGILWVIASLSCLVVAVQRVRSQQPLSFRVMLVWIGVNTLGVATHFFFLLTLAAAGMAVLVTGWFTNGGQWQRWGQPPWRRIYLAMAGTMAGIAVWIPLWMTIRDREITQWIQSDAGFEIGSLINPPFQQLAAWVTMLALLPVESNNLSIVILSGTAMIVFFFWLAPIGWRGLKTQWQTAKPRLVIPALVSFVGGAIALFFLITYFLGADLTRGARYSFVYFPGVILLLAASLAVCWRQESDWSWQSLLHGYGKQVVILVWIVSLLSGITVVNNLGYRKYYRPERLVTLMQSNTDRPMLIATTQSTLVHIGEIMGVGWILRSQSDLQPQFLFAHEASLPCESDCRATEVLQDVLADVLADLSETAIANQSQPLDLWLVGFNAPVDLTRQGCTPDWAKPQGIYGYPYERYHCGDVQIQPHEDI